MSVAQEKFEQLGDEPTFTIHVRDEDGRIDAQKYRLEGVMVRRVIAPGEPAVKVARAKPERGKGNKQ